MEEINMSASQSEKLLMVWTSGEIEVAKKMVFMYSMNAKLHGWWEEVTLLVWGPSSKLLAGDAGLQEELKTVQDAGVKVIACKSCAEKFVVVPDLEALGIDVFYTGEFLTDWIKSGDKYITF
jgi:hypothetical protein